MRESESTIVVIEDEPPIRRFLLATLTTQGYHLIEAASGQEGLDQVAEHQSQIILLDLGLPDIDGLQVTRRLREWTATPIIVLSASPSQALGIGSPWSNESTKAQKTHRKRLSLVCLHARPNQSRCESDSRPLVPS
jgi:CheY-like chemotaxis protein